MNETRSTGTTRLSPGRLPKTLRWLAASTMVVAAAVVLAPRAHASQPILGAIVGGGAGAMIGQSIGGRDGAVIGGAIGAAAGAATYAIGSLVGVGLA
jgi:outer membrane lipoprotein SlyB